MAMAAVPVFKETYNRRARQPGRTPENGQETSSQAPDQAIFKWARQDLNLQPTDHESEKEGSDHKGKDPEKGL